MIRNKEKCKHRIEKEMEINGVYFDGCRMSRRNLPFDICDCESEFCEKHYKEKGEIIWKRK